VCVNMHFQSNKETYTILISWWNPSILILSDHPVQSCTISSLKSVFGNLPTKSMYQVVGSKAEEEWKARWEDDYSFET
jgi:hypothetical protein